MNRNLTYGQKENKLVRLKDITFAFDIKKKFFAVKVVRHRHRLSRQACGCPIPGCVQAVLDGALSMEGVTAHCSRVGIRWSLRSLPVQAPFYVSLILWVLKKQKDVFIL